MKKLMLLFLISSSACAQDVVVVDKATAAQNKRISLMTPKKRDHYHNYPQVRSYDLNPRPSETRYSGSRYGRGRQEGATKPTRVRRYRFGN